MTSLSRNPFRPLGLANLIIGALGLLFLCFQIWQAATINRSPPGAPYYVQAVWLVIAGGLAWFGLLALSGFDLWRTKYRGIVLSQWLYGGLIVGHVLLTLVAAFLSTGDARYRQIERSLMFAYTELPIVFMLGIAIIGVIFLWFLRKKDVPHR